MVGGIELVDTSHSIQLPIFFFLFIDLIQILYLPFHLADTIFLKMGPHLKEKQCEKQEKGSRMVLHKETLALED